MATKKKAAKKTGKALAKKGQFNGPIGNHLAQALKPKPFAQALKEYDAAVGKAYDLRTVLLGSNQALDSWEVTAYRASRLQRLAHEVSQAAFCLEQAAQAEADK